MNAARRMRISTTSGAVLFDIDGTLADTDPVHAKAWQIVADRRFGVTITWDEYQVACLVGNLTPMELLRRRGVAATAEEESAAAAEKSAVFLELIADGLALTPGVVELVRSVDQAGVPIAIVSSGSRRSVDAFVEFLWPVAPPPVTVSREDTQRQKPDPAPYLLALERLQRSARSCVAFEDTDRGVLSARQAGLRTVRLALGQASPRPDGDLVVPDFRSVRVASDGPGAVVIVVRRPEDDALPE